MTLPYNDETKRYETDRQIRIWKLFELGNSIMTRTAHDMKLTNKSNPV